MDTPGAPERGESWSCSGPAELDLALELGQVEVALAERDGVELRLRPDAERLGSWSGNLSGLLGWLGGGVGEPGGSIRIGGTTLPFGGLDLGRLGLGDLAGGDLAGGALAAQAVRAAQVSWTEGERRLVVRSATSLPARLMPLTLTVRAPVESTLVLRTASGDITVTGRAGGARVRTGSGDVRLDSVAELELAAGSGTATVRAALGRARAKTGSGDLTLRRVEGPAFLRTGSGGLWLGAVRGEVTARTGSGALTIADLQTGSLDLTAGSGDLRVGVHPGVAAELDLSSASGRARSELPVTERAPEGVDTAVRVRGRTGSGDILVNRADAPAAAA
jgi:DUF4097 and DUF4098 domain-containing protein YvlB